MAKKPKPLSASVRKNLQERAKKSTRYTFSDLKKVFQRGQGAFLSSGSRPGITSTGWAYGRVKSFLRGGSHDADIRRAARKRKK
tara:strand:+ start:2473 stop:2724 length:252 start_codon:yes stop_codon:yes gene_type:complete